MPDYGWEVMLWNPVTGWSPHGKSSQAAGITVGYNGTAQAFAEQLLNERARELGNSGGRLRVTASSYDPGGPPSEILAEAEITLPAKASDRYVVARISKTYATLGERPGPQHVGKTFVPYDDRHLSKEAAEASAANSNDRYRPSLHGKTYIAVRAEPIPGTNKFRNLDHPSMTAKATAAARAAEIKAEAAKYGLTVSAVLSRDFNPATGEMDGKAIDATVTVEGTFTPGDRRAYLAAEAIANTVLRMIPMVRPGSVWGTDSASVGGPAGITGGYVRMNKSGAEIAVARHLAGARPSTGGGTSAATRAASAKARKPGRRHIGQQVPPRTRGRGQ